MQTYEELREENIKLQKANKKLREEIAKLMAIITVQAEEIRELKKEITRMKDKLNKNSGNSSKPPSSDGFKKIVNLREASGRRVGGQVGHEGHRLSLPKDIDKMVENGTAEKRLVNYAGESERYISRWTIDVEIKTIVTEYRYANAWEIPTEQQNEVSYGENIRALTLLLSAEGAVSEGRIAEFFESVTKGAVKPSEGTINAFLSEFAGKIDTEALKERLLNGKTMNVDESPMRSTEREMYDKTGERRIENAKGKTYQTYVRTHSNDDTTLYTVNGQKDGAGVVRDNILPLYKGIIIQDFDVKYLKYGAKHGLCGAHLLRELKGIGNDWSEEMTECLTNMNDYKRANVSKGVKSCESDIFDYFENDYTDTVNRGFEYWERLDEESIESEKMEPLLNRLSEHKDEYLLFMKDFAVPFTNNLAERDLRPCKTKQKISGCFRSWSGINAYCKIRSVISTAKKRGFDLFQTIKNIARGEPVFS